MLCMLNNPLLGLFNLCKLHLHFITSKIFSDFREHEKNFRVYLAEMD